MQHMMILGKKFYGNPSDPNSIGLAEQFVDDNGVICVLCTTILNEDAMTSSSLGLITNKGYSGGSSIMTVRMKPSVF